MGKVETAKKALERAMDPKAALDQAARVSGRNKRIIRTSIIGILANAFLAGFKAVIGVMTHSVAITMDAVNNLSDAGSSLITIVGTKLAGREPDKKHPFGYGRIEYLSAMIISIIVLYAGVTSFSESVKKIIRPEKPDYTMVALLIVAVAVLVKIVLGRYVKKVGKEVNSDSLVNSGEDAALDSIISASTLAAAFIYILSGLSLESWLGAGISLVIIKSGIDMLRETLSEILGERADASLARQIKATVVSFDGVRGAYDLVLNNYGPDTFNGSIHIEIPDTYSADQIDDLIRRIQYAVLEKHHVVLTAVGVYSINTKDEDAVKVRKKVREIVMADPYIRQMHGFYLMKDPKVIRCDVVVSFDSPDRQKTYEKAMKEVQAAFPDYQVIMAMDLDYSEM